MTKRKIFIEINAAFVRSHFFFVVDQLLKKARNVNIAQELKTAQFSYFGK